MKLSLIFANDGSEKLLEKYLPLEESDYYHDVEAEAKYGSEYDSPEALHLQPKANNSLRVSNERLREYAQRIANTLDQTVYVDLDCEPKKIEKFKADSNPDSKNTIYQLFFEDLQCKRNEVNRLISELDNAVNCARSSMSIKEREKLSHKDHE